MITAKENELPLILHKVSALFFIEFFFWAWLIFSSHTTVANQPG